MPLASCLVDTNILIRGLRRHGDLYPEVARAINQLILSGTPLFYTHQNIAEMWNVMTRPAQRNGLGLTIDQAQAEVLAVEAAMHLLPENELVYRRWRDLIVKHQVQGVQVHDARLVATMTIHHVAHILTLNEADFRRFTEIETLSPRTVLQKAGN